MTADDVGLLLFILLLASTILVFGAYYWFSLTATEAKQGSRTFSWSREHQQEHHSITARDLAQELGLDSSDDDEDALTDTEDDGLLGPQSSLPGAKQLLSLASMLTKGLFQSENLNSELVDEFQALRLRMAAIRQASELQNVVSQVGPIYHA